MGQTSAPKVLESPDSTVRRQKMTTWGIVALAVFVAVGMGEWSKRSAANEVVMDPKILEQAMAIAAEARDSGVKGLREKVGVRGRFSFPPQRRARRFLAIHGKLERVGFSEGFGCLVF